MRERCNVQDICLSTCRYSCYPHREIVRGDSRAGCRNKTTNGESARLLGHYIEKVTLPPFLVQHSLTVM